MTIRRFAGFKNPDDREFIIKNKLLPMMEQLGCKSVEYKETTFTTDLDGEFVFMVEAIGSYE